MEQLIPTGYCAACQGCCRFAAPGGAWAVKLLTAEQSALRLQQDRVPLTESQADKLWYCAYLDRAANACTIYGRRPFECQLYPFLLNLRDGSVFLACDPNCPYVRQHRETEPFQAYVRYLQECLCADPLRLELELAGRLAASYEGVIDCARLLPRQPV